MSAIEKKYNEGLKLIEDKKWAEAEKYYLNLEVERKDDYKLMGNYWIRQKLAPLKKDRDLANSVLEKHRVAALNIPVIIAQIILQSNQIERGLTFLKDRSQKSPGNLALHKLLLSTFMLLEKIGEAEEYFVALRKKNYGSIQAAEILVETYLQQGKVGKAEPIVKFMIERAPTYAMGWFYHGNILHQNKDIDGALAAFSKTTSLARKYDKGWENLGIVFLQKNNLERAEHALQRALTLNAHNFNCWYNLAIIRRLQENFSQAIEFLEKGLKIQPNSILLWNGYIDTLEMIGDFPKLKGAYEELLTKPLSAEDRDKIKKKLAAL